eukprot:TRINITY_DN11274_c0_g1_i1.p1 TRINITY_DN11274_c0_g1~~TRINITY_DN11274_c0_g1_i1.p1  ORF type:complete len:391 (+),score=39.09 TRINITY_DN11274_c0_g1_i1:2-1174(+)
MNAFRSIRHCNTRCVTRGWPSGTFSRPYAHFTFARMVGRSAVQCLLVTRDERVRRRTQYHVLGAFRVPLASGENVVPVSVPVHSTLTFPTLRVGRNGDAVMSGGNGKFAGPTVEYSIGHVVGHVQVYFQCIEQELWRRRGVYINSSLRKGLVDTSHWLTPQRSYKCPLVFAHRGIVDLASDTENSISSLKSAANMGIEGVEIDVFYYQHASGSYLVVAHDDDLTRMLGIHSHITKMEKDGINELRGISGCAVLTPLSSFLKVIKENRLLANIELKPGSPFASGGPAASKRFSQAVGEEIRRLGVERNVVVSSFDPIKTRYINTGASGEVPILTSTASYKSTGAKALYFLNKHLKPGRGDLGKSTAGCFHYSQITKELVDSYHARGAPVGA